MIHEGVIAAQWQRPGDDEAPHHNCLCRIDGANPLCCHCHCSRCFVGVVVAILIVFVIAWRHCNHRCCRHPLLPSSVVAVAIVVAVALATVFVACCPRCHHHHCPICLNILVPTLFLLSIVVLVICSALNIHTR